MTARARILAAVSAAALAVLLSACVPNGLVSTPTPSPVIQRGAIVGTWTEQRASTSPSLSLAADGTFFGSDGCNSIGGTWTYSDDGQVIVDLTSSTEIACEEIDTWLTQAAAGRVQANVMTIESADGTVVGQLEGSQNPPSSGSKE